MVALIGLPQYKAQPLMDFSSINDAIDSRNQAAWRMAQMGEDTRRWNETNALNQQKFGLQRAQDAREAEMAPLKRDLVQAQIQEAQRKAAMGGEQPANVREWRYYNNLSPEDQQRYLTMRRAQPWLNTGTEFVQPSAVNPTTQNAAIPIDTAGKKRAEAIGEAGGKAAADLPRIVGNANQTLDLIRGIKTNPGTARNFGVIGMFPNVPGSQASDAWSRIEQLGGKAFLEAFNSLKGGGQITEVEGQKATNAIIAMNKAQSYESFIQALTDFESVIKAGVARAQGNAGLGASGGGSGPSGAPQRLRYNPQTGELE